MSNKNLLCEDCKKLGYCMLTIPVEVPEKYLTDSEIRNKVAVKSEDPDISKKFLRKLQQAHDLFHQEEYEQASYLYQDMLTSRNNSTEVKVGLAASFYFLKKYNEAAAFATRIDAVYLDKFANELIKTCEKKLTENQNEKSNISLHTAYCDTKILISK